MALYLSGAAVANVELSDTFNVWRLRTNAALSDAGSISGNNTFTGTQTFNNTVAVSGGTLTVSANASFTGANTDVTGYLKMLGSGQMRVPVGNTAQRIEGVTGSFRYNSELDRFEGYTSADGWGEIGGGGLGKFLITTTTYTAAAGDRIAADTSSAAFTVTLPASPATDDIIEFIDKENSFNLNNLTIDRNGNTIEGLTEDLVADISGTNFFMQYNGTTWEVFGIATGTQYFEGTLSVNALVVTNSITANTINTSNNVVVAGTVTANNFVGDGSLLTNAGISTGKAIAMSIVFG